MDSPPPRVIEFVKYVMSLPAMSRSNRAFTPTTCIWMPSDASVWNSVTSRSEILSSALPPTGMLMIVGSGCDECIVPSVDCVCIGPGTTFPPAYFAWVFGSVQPGNGSLSLQVYPPTVSG